LSINDYNDLPVVIIGSGGHAKVLIDCLQMIGRKILFCTEIENSLHGSKVLDIEVQGLDELILDLDPAQVRLVNGMGSIGPTVRRKDVYDRFREKGFTFASMVHPTATVSRSVCLGEGVQVMAGAVVQAGTQIANNTIINTSASVDHDCSIGAHCHIAPRVALSGGVTIENSTHIGIGASVIQGVNIGENCVIGAGATVLKDIPNNSKAVGTPAKVLPQKS